MYICVLGGVARKEKSDEGKKKSDEGRKKSDKGKKKSDKGKKKSDKGKNMARQLQAVRDPTRRIPFLKGYLSYVGELRVTNW